MTRYDLAEPAPFEHQMKGTMFLAARKGTAALLCDPGTGKTRMVVDYLGMLATRYSEKPVRVLIVAPKSVKDSWLKEFDKWLGPGVGYYAEVLQGKNIAEKCKRLQDGIEPGPYREGISGGREGDGRMVLVALINIEALSSRRVKKGTTTVTDADLLMRAVKKWAPDVLVCDESHRLKSPTGNAARMAARLAMQVPRRILMTGTPMPHGPMDVWAQWKILDRETFGTWQASGCEPWSFDQFKQQYAMLGGFGGQQVIGYQRLDDMQERMEPASYVVHKRDCLDLPPVTEVDLTFDLSPVEREAYRAMKRDMQVAMENGTFMTSENKLSQMMRLRQVTCGFVTTDDGEKIPIGSSRLDACVQLLEDLLANEDRVVIFAWSRWECEQLNKRLLKSPIYGAIPLLITGETREGDRLKIRNSFGSSAPGKQVLIAQARTVSLGVNELVSASHGIFLSLTQQRDDLIQAIARLDRQGQTRPVTLYFLLGKGTIDQVVLQSHRERTDLETAVMNYLKES